MIYTFTFAHPKTFTWGCVSVKKLVYMASNILHLTSFTNVFIFHTQH
jgi:hypothetical protein